MYCYYSPIWGWILGVVLVVGFWAFLLASFAFVLWVSSPLALAGLIYLRFRR